MIKKLLFCFSAGIMTMGLGLGIVYAGEFLISIFQTEEKVEIVETDEPVTEVQKESLASLDPIQIPPNQIPVEELIYPKRAVETKEEETNEFDPDGTYYIISEPVGFKEVSNFYITTFDYLKASQENSYDYKNYRIPPKGGVDTTEEFSFTHIAINGRKIAFETETKNGISYEFTGEFMGEEREEFKVEYKYEDGEIYTYYADLKGTLIKKRNGKMIAESDVKLEMGGC